MPLKKTTVMVDEEDLKAVKDAAAREWASGVGILPGGVPHRCTARPALV